MTKRVAEGDDAGRRADEWVAKAYEVSRSRAVEMLAMSQVTVNGARVKPSYRIEEGDVLSGEPPAAAPAALKPGKGSVSIVYQDDALVVVDKPAGLSVHPGSGRPDGTLVNVLLGMGIPLAPAGGAIRPGVVHRLDMNTTGLLVLAKTDKAYWKLAAMAEAHELHREYLAVTAKVPDPRTGIIDAPIGRDHRHRERFAVVDHGGKTAVTHFAVDRVLGKKAALVRVTLETGRTHQIRVHFAAMGWPLVGDETYGGALSRSAYIIRQALHAATLGFKHPVTNRERTFTAPLPADLAELIKRLEGSGTP